MTTQITPDVLFDRLVTLFHEENTLKADVKALLDEAKEEGIENIQAIKAAAKLKADEKQSDWQEKVDAIKAVLESKE